MPPEAGISMKCTQAIAAGDWKRSVEDRLCTRAVQRLVRRPPTPPFLRPPWPSATLCCQISLGLAGLGRHDQVAPKALGGKFVLLVAYRQNVMACRQEDRMYRFPGVCAYLPLAP